MLHAFYKKHGKRLLDLSLLLIMAPLVIPLVAVLAALVRWRLGAPVIYQQARGGRGGSVFKIYKFRTMTEQRDEHGELLPDELRLTPFGRLLRASSLDELPELWNVLLGQMSLVGPRPFLAKYLSLYTPQEARRHDVRPGVTGWAQINGRNNTTWEERLKLDVWYVDHVGFWLDVRILLATIVQVLARKDVNAKGHSTMPEFTR